MQKERARLKLHHVHIPGSSQSATFMSLDIENNALRIKLCKKETAVYSPLRKV